MEDQQQSLQSSEMPKASPLEGSLTTMPAYYLPKGGGAAASGGMSKKMLLLIVGAIVLLLVVVIVLLVFQSGSSQPIATNNTPQQTSLPEQQESPAVTTPQEEDEPEEEVIVEEPAEEEPEVTDEDLSDLIPVIVLTGVAQDVDTDQDGLTDSEEMIFLTSSAAPDTDQDSFLDGAELTSLYDPATPGALLEVSPQIKVARNSARGYQLLIPQSFTYQPIDTAGMLVEITPATGTGVFSIQVVENPERMTPVQWYQAVDPLSDLSRFNNFQNEAGWNGVQSQDGRVVIATYGTSGPGSRAFIFIMHYDPGTDAILRYPAIWEMMLQSLSLLEVDPEESAQ